MSAPGDDPPRPLTEADVRRLIRDELARIGQHVDRGLARAVEEHRLRQQAEAELARLKAGAK